MFQVDPWLIAIVIIFFVALAAALVLLILWIVRKLK